MPRPPSKGGALATANSIAVYLPPACGSAAAITKIAADPSTVDWLNGITASLNALAATAAP